MPVISLDRFSGEIPRTPAHLLPDGAALAGHNTLEALNREGLKLRAQGKTPKDIRREKWARHKRRK